MELPAPSIKGFTSAISLSKLKDPVDLSIPNEADIPVMNDVYAILGKNPETPDWCGAKVQAGQWNDEIEDIERVRNLSVTVPKKELEKHLNESVTLRYQTSGEWGLVTSSVQLDVRIEP
jgi:hypothetical protein